MTRDPADIAASCDFDLHPWQVRVLTSLLDPHRPPPPKPVKRTGPRVTHIVVDELDHMPPKESL